jgi:hypothetical protein
MWLYLALMSGRALLLQEWAPVRITDVFLPAEIDWRCDATMTARFPARPGSMRALGLNMDPTLITNMLNSAFSDAPVVLGFSNRSPSQLLANISRHHVCDDDSVEHYREHVWRRWVADNATTTPGDGPVWRWTPHFGVPWRSQPGRFCMPAATWDVLFNRSHGDAKPVPVGLALDFLFRPNPAFVNASLLPLLQSLPAWQCDGPRVGVHFRTLAADKMCVPRCTRVPSVVRAAGGAHLYLLVVLLQRPWLLLLLLPAVALLCY